ncbi:hypothetical protein ISS37_03715 [candidate division KSB1 bacterium]|nr:hypothetical protein [candidate division KSB1 bacterium]
MAKQLKRAILQLLEKRHNIEVIAGESVFQLNSRAVIYLRYSKDHNGKYYFGITETDFKKYASNNFFILFICADENNVIVMPSNDLEKLIVDSKVASGQWKLNIFVENNKFYLRVSGKGKFDVTDYLNYYDFTPMEFRKGYIPKVKDFIPVKKPKETVEEKGKVKGILTLEDRLKTSLRDSENPDNFENALCEFFNEIGFKARKIGGPGDTDVLVEKPVSFIVDGKSTKSSSISRINFTRLKQHKKSHDADFILVVSVGFDPAVIRDAELEESSLVNVKTLLRLLEIHRNLPLSPHEYVAIFSKKGLISDEDLKPLEEKIQEIKLFLDNVLFIVENLDFKSKNIDVIRGGLDAKCELMKRPFISKKEIEEILKFLSSNIINIVEVKDSKYSLRYFPSQAAARFRSLLKLLYFQG